MPCPKPGVFRLLTYELNNLCSCLLEAVQNFDPSFSAQNLYPAMVDSLASLQPLADMALAPLAERMAYKQAASKVTIDNR